MANILHRTTKQLILSADTGQYDEADWIINPDITNMVGVPTKYWNISGDVVTEMSQSEKDAIDAAETKQWRFHCVEEDKWFWALQSLAPDICPSNEIHTIDNATQQISFSMGLNESEISCYLFLDDTNSIIVAEDAI